MLQKEKGEEVSKVASKEERTQSNPSLAEVGWGTNLMHKWKSLGQNIGIQNVALARLLNTLSEDLGFSPRSSSRAEFIGGVDPLVEAVGAPVGVKSLKSAQQFGKLLQKSGKYAYKHILKKFSPEFAEKVTSPLIHNTSFSSLQKILKSGGIKGLHPGPSSDKSIISPITGERAGGVSLTRSWDDEIPYGKTLFNEDVKAVVEKTDLRNISGGRTTPVSWQPNIKSVKASGADESEEVFRQKLSRKQTSSLLGQKTTQRAYKDQPMIPTEYLRGLIVRGGDQFATSEGMSTLGALNVPTMLTHSATKRMMKMNPRDISRSQTQNVFPTYEVGSPESTRVLMELIEFLSKQGR